MSFRHEVKLESDAYLSRRISIYDTYPGLIPAYSINGEVVGSLQNFTLVSGPAKSRKTYFISSIVVARLIGSFGKVSAESGGRILYIDTEQGYQHCHNVLLRIMKYSGLLMSDIEDKVCFLALREDKTVDRLTLVEQAICEQVKTGVDFVILDGLRDIVVDLNSPEESIAIIDKLMEWTAKFNIHILTVLHENKGNTQLRGWTGSEAGNKAEAVIRIEKTSDSSSKVEPKFMRNKEFPAFEFQVDPDGGMSMRDIQKTDKGKPLEFDIDLIKGIANGVFREQSVYHSKQLFNSAIRKFYFDTNRKTIGEKKGYSLIETMEAAGVIEIKKINSRTMEITAPSFKNV